MSLFSCLRTCYLAEGNKMKKNPMKQKPPKFPALVEHSEYTTLGNTFAVNLMPSGENRLPRNHRTVRI